MESDVVLSQNLVLCETYQNAGLKNAIWFRQYENISLNFYQNVSAFGFLNHCIKNAIIAIHGIKNVRQNFSI